MSDLAAFWCSVLACDRACASWSIRLLDGDIQRTAAMRLAWRAFSLLRHRTDLSTAERWAEAEAMLRSGRYYYRGGWRRWR